MKYDFNQETHRANTYALKWDGFENELPMWVADMDFKTAPCVQEALQNRVNHGIFGYSIVPPAYFESIQQWWKKRHRVNYDPAWMLFSTGVVPAISSIVRKITTPAENVLIQSPVYNIFYNSIYNNGRNILSSDLVYQQGEYAIDFNDLEQKLALPQTTLMILCNPHNPIGKIWSKEELAQIGELCAKYHVTVLSDEIHCDIVEPGYHYTPFASVNATCQQISITCVAASKVFNLAGLQSACVIVPDPFLRHKVNRGLNTDEVAEPNAFAVTANIAAFSYGEEWVEELNQYINENKQLWMNYIKQYLPQLHIVPSHATYLVWMDISYYSKDADLFVAELRKQTGLYITSGSEYGKNAKTFVRVNLATQRKNVEQALQLLFQFLNEKETSYGTI